jgi:hypothetical protein
MTTSHISAGRIGGALLALGTLGLVAALPVPADARAVITFGIGVPVYDPYYYAPPAYYPPPAYYAPPVYAAPAPVVVAPAPAAQTWYYCDHPRGYYPDVSACPTGWRQVAR